MDSKKIEVSLTVRALYVKCDWLKEALKYSHAELSLFYTCFLCLLLQSYESSDNDSLDVAGLVGLWREFRTLYLIAGEDEFDKCGITHEEFARRCRQWGADFVRLTFVEDVTPYIHGKYLIVK